MTGGPRVDAPLTLGAQLEARAADPQTSDRVALRSGARSWTYRQFRDEAARYAHLLRRRLGYCDEARPPHVAMLLDNHPELLALLAACGYDGMTLFGVNTGLRGETLAGVVNQSRARLMIVDQRLLPEVERVRDKLEHVPAENLLVLRTRSPSSTGGAAATTASNPSGDPTTRSCAASSRPRNASSCSTARILETGLEPSRSRARAKGTKTNSAVTPSNM